MRLALVLLVGSLVIGMAPARAGAQAEPSWTVAPFGVGRAEAGVVAIEVNGSVGAVRNDLLAITNRSDRAIALELRPVTARTDDGVLRFEAASSPNDTSRWITLPAVGDTVAVAAGASRAVPVQVRFPNTAVPGQRLAAVEVRQVGTDRIEHVPVRVRTDGVMRDELSFARADLTVARPSFAIAEPAVARLAYEARNTGNTVLAGDLVVQLDTVFGQKIVLERRADVVVLPGSAVSGIVETDAWPTFTFVPEIGIEQEISIPDGEPLPFVVGDRGRELTVVPVAQIRVAVGVLALTGAGWVVLRRRAAQRATVADLAVAS